MNITKRDVKVFLLGMLAMVIIDIVTDWPAHVKAFKEGLRDGYNATSTK